MMMNVEHLSRTFAPIAALLIQSINSSLCIRDFERPLQTVLELVKTQRIQLNVSLRSASKEKAYFFQARS